MVLPLLHKRVEKLQCLRHSNANILQSLSIDTPMYMNPIKGTGARVMPQGLKGHWVKSLEKKEA